MVPTSSKAALALGAAPRNLALRLFAGLALAALVAVSLFWLPSWFFGIALGVFTGMGLYEFFTMLKQRGVRVYRLFGVVIGLIIPFVVYFQGGFSRSGEVLFIVLACFGLFLIQLSRTDEPHALEGIALTFFGMMYISWFLSFLLKIKFLPGGPLWIAYLLVVSKGGDIGAYGFGTLWGTHALIPHVSPKKTIEGTLGGLGSSMVLSSLFYGSLPLELSRIELTALGFLLGLVSGCGDLAESLIKRYCHVKDSGGMIPGFGGFLDLMDSVLFTAPLFYFYLLKFY